MKKKKNIKSIKSHKKAKSPVILDLDVEFNKAEIEIAQGKIKIALQRLNKLINNLRGQNKVSPYALVLRLQCNRDLNKTVNVLEDIHKLISIANNNVRILEVVARNYLLLGMMEEGKEICRKMLEINGENAPAYFLLGWFTMNDRDLVKAILLFDKAIIYDPKMYEAYAYRGIAYEIAGKNLEALNDFEKIPASETKIQLIIIDSKTRLEESKAMILKFGKSSSSIQALTDLYDEKYIDYILGESRKDELNISVNIKAKDSVSNTTKSKKSAIELIERIMLDEFNEYRISETVPKEIRIKIRSRIKELFNREIKDNILRSNLSRLGYKKAQT